MLMMSVKIDTPAFLKLRFLEILFMTSKFMSVMSSTYFYRVVQIILWIWSFDQSLVTLAFL